VTGAKDWSLEVVILPVSDLDCAVAFYRKKPLIPLECRGRFGSRTRLSLEDDARRMARTGPLASRVLEAFAT